MKKLIYGLLATISGLVLLFSYRTSLEAIPPEATSAGSATSAGAGTSAGTQKAPEQSSAPAGSASALADGTYTGDSASTRYGPVQVQIDVAGRRITDVQVVDFPDGNGRDRQINASALPRLVSETLQVQSAEIDMVSGATYTSRGYRASLQSALDQASQ